MDSEDSIENSPAAADFSDLRSSRKRPRESLGNAAATTTAPTTSSGKKQRRLKGREKQPETPTPALQPISFVNPLAPKSVTPKQRPSLPEFKTITGSFTSRESLHLCPSFFTHFVVPIAKPSVTDSSARDHSSMYPIQLR